MNKYECEELFQRTYILYRGLNFVTHISNALHLFILELLFVFDILYFMQWIVFVCV